MWTILQQGPAEIKVGYAKRRWLTIYCYDGTFMDPNTGCYESITLKNPTCKDLRNWIRQDECPTGWECAPDGDCVAGLANTRCYDGTTIKETKGPKSLKWKGTRFLRFPVHTCTSSWECNSFEAEVPIFGKYNHDHTFDWVFYDKDNKEHKVNKESIEKGISSSTGEILCPFANLTDKVSIELAECYAESRENIKCIVKGESEHNGIVFDVSSSGSGVLRNLKFEVLGQLLVPENGRLIDLNKDKYDEEKRVPTMLTDRQRAVNVETAHELAINANILQMQSLYNILSLGQEIDEIYNALIQLTRSQSISDPTIISKILGKSRFALKWSNEEVFEQCSCVQDIESEKSNCVGERRYNYGSYVKNDDRSKCYYIPPEDVKNVSLVDSAMIHTEFIKYLPPQTASSDSAAWDALNEYRNQLVNGDKSSHSYENLNDKVNGIVNSIGFKKIFQYFLYATYIASWASIFILVCVRR